LVVASPPSLRPFPTAARGRPPSSADAPTGTPRAWVPAL